MQSTYHPYPYGSQYPQMSAHPQAATAYTRTTNPQAASRYYHYATESGYPQTGTNTYASSASPVGSWFDFSNSSYLKGFVLGAGVTLMLANPAVQKAMVRGTVKLWSLVQGGMEEVKEQFQDIKAEMSEES